ncbi:TonB-dependent receptor [Oceaniserpentilla sp. 4NH20-0058]|uniref:TonB-dependent receptor plug domain-containing protein n=1 Tax=Oceaniserpentilla sp. 4NH20-0058 TaxID=3127660 RepID=UPI003105F92B
MIKNICSMSYLGLLLASNVMADSDYLTSLSFSEFDLPEFDAYSVPVVLTATRIQQHQADVPASVTILDEAFIKQVSAQNLSELLRYVPGMMIGHDKNSNGDAVHYHGGPAALPKNLQVLVNGRSMYRAGLASVSWYELPVAIEDIKRIEVVRGPNAASYGANAFQAIINILTKHPADTYGTSASLQKGNNGEENVYLRQGGRLGNSDYRVSFTQKKTDLFAEEFDSRQSQFLDVEHYYQGSQFGELETSFVLSDSSRDLEDTFDFQTNENQVSEQRLELGSQWTKDVTSKHQVKIKGYFTRYEQTQMVNLEAVPLATLDDNLRQLYLLNPDAADALVAGLDPIPLLDLTNSDEVALATTISGTYLPLGAENPFAPVNGEINLDLSETRYDIEIQDTYVFSPSLTLVSGASFRRDEVDSQTYFSGLLVNDTYRVFGSATWQATEKVNLHLGLMAEKESDADLVFAPRTALIYKLEPNKSIRFVYSEAVRSPDLFEQNANWQLVVDNPQSSVELNGNTYYQIQQGPGNLDHQLIKSFEVGYYAHFNQLSGELDVRIFQEDLTDVYYQSLTISELETINGISMAFQGIEWQYTIKPWDEGKLRWVGAWIDAQTNLDELGEQSREQVLLRVFTKNAHTLSWLQQWSPQFTSSLSYLLVNSYDEFAEDSSDQTRMERLDAKFNRNIQLSGVGLDVFVNFQHDLISDAYIWDNAVFEDDTRIQLGVKVNL